MTLHLQQHLTLTFAPTVERAAESLSACGLRGSQRQIAEHIEAATIRVRVARSRVALYIAGQYSEGWRVVDVK